MAADMPYDREVDQEAAERHREKLRASERRARIRTEMHRAAGAGPGGRREPGSPPLTQRVTVLFDVGETERLERAARELGVSVKTLVRAAALVLVSRAEGRL